MKIDDYDDYTEDDSDSAWMERAFEDRNLNLLRELQQAAYDITHPFRTVAPDLLAFNRLEDAVDKLQQTSIRVKE